MPRRVKTPPPPGDVQFFTIYQPYPFNANMRSHIDRVKCARWIAEMIDPEWLVAILYRTRAMVGSTAWTKYKANAAPHPKDPVVLSGVWAVKGRGATPGMTQIRSSVQVNSSSNRHGPIPSIVTSSAKIGAWGKGKPSFSNMDTSSKSQPAASKPKDASAWGAPNPRITPATPPVLISTSKAANSSNGHKDYNDGTPPYPPPRLSGSNGTAHPSILRSL
uniref:Uncharacterized protein n=1 Tax=Moniliophthora roreri TaxID=221103 RepID=A0A0W0FJ24_MONRR